MVLRSTDSSAGSYLIDGQDAVRLGEVLAQVVDSWFKGQESWISRECKWREIDGEPSPFIDTSRKGSGRCRLVSKCSVDHCSRKVILLEQYFPISYIVLRLVISFKPPNLMPLVHTRTSKGASAYQVTRDRLAPPTQKRRPPPLQSAPPNNKQSHPGSST